MAEKIEIYIFNARDGYDKHEKVGEVRIDDDTNIEWEFDSSHRHYPDLKKVFVRHQKGEAGVEGGVEPVEDQWARRFTDPTAKDYRRSIMKKLLKKDNLFMGDPDGIDDRT